MQVTVLGTGGVGLGSAALAAQGGHMATLWSPSMKAGDVVIESEGAIAGRFPARAAADVAAAVAGADVVLFAVPGWAHRGLMDAIAPVMEQGQTIVVGSHVSLGGLYVRRLLDERGSGAAVVAWGTTAVTGRRIGPLGCRLSNVRSKVDAAAVPSGGNAAGLAVCRDAFGDRFEPRANLLAIQLSNLNPQNHLAMLLCNLTRAERGEAWGNYWAITPAVGRLMEALDAERMGLAQRLGVAVRTLREHFHLSFQVPMGPVWEQAAAVDARGNAPMGPTTLETRYISEDVPYGVAATEWLGRQAGFATPLHTAGAELFGGLTGRDLRADNNLLPALGIEGLDRLVQAAG